MQHRSSIVDRRLKSDFERGETPPSSFDHRRHVLMAYVYLCELGVEEAHARMKQALLAYLEHIGAGSSKYHETITRAWIMAVHYFMTQTDPCASADEFIERNPRLLDKDIMLSHYSPDVLFSGRARSRFLPPDRSPIPDRSRSGAASDGKKPDTTC